MKETNESRISRQTDAQRKMNARGSFEKEHVLFSPMNFLYLFYQQFGFRKWGRGRLLESERFVINNTVSQVD